MVLADRDEYQKQQSDDPISEKFGFKIVRTSRGYQKSPWEATVVMERRLRIVLLPTNHRIQDLQTMGPSAD